MPAKRSSHLHHRYAGKVVRLQAVKAKHDSSHPLRINQEIVPAKGRTG